MLILHVIIGLILLFFGRKLFWLLVAVSGFMVGVQFAEMMFPYYQQWIQFAIAIGVGIFSALMAILVQRVAFVLAGFLAGLYMALMLRQSFGLNDISTLIFIFGGAAGAVAGYIFIDWAIVVLSAMIGSGLVVSVLIDIIRLPPSISIFSFMFLSITGAVFQMRFIGDITGEN